MIGPHDSTLLEFLYSLGWGGTFIYGTGLFLLCLQLFRSGRGDYLALAGKAILIGLFVQALLNSIMLGVLGFMVWTFASLCLVQSENAEAVRRLSGYEYSEIAGSAIAWEPE